MKKICFVTTVFVTYKSFLIDLSKYLYKTGEYDISLICNNEDVIEEIIPEFVHYHPVSMQRGVSLSMFSAIKEIQKIFEKEQFDIVQYSTPNAAFYASIAAKRAKVPVRLYCQWGIRYMGFEGWRRQLFKFLEKMTCKNSTYIEVESHNIRNFSLEEGLYTKEKSCVIWNGSACGVDLKRYDMDKKETWRTSIRKELNISKEDVVFAFAARLTADKGINELLDAFMKLEASYSNVKLLVMGGMDNSDSLDAELMRKAKKTENIIFTGNVAGIERYYAASDIFVAPSYREGFGLVVIEAEAMGIPAIVSNVPGQIDAIEDNVTGLSCQVKDADSLKQSMEYMLDHVEKRISMGKAAREFVEMNFEQEHLFQYLKEHRDLLIRR